MSFFFISPMILICLNLLVFCKMKVGHYYKPQKKNNSNHKIKVLRGLNDCFESTSLLMWWALLEMWLRDGNDERFRERDYQQG